MTLMGKIVAINGQFRNGKKWGSNVGGRI